MKKLHHHFVYHLRSYRTFYFMFFTFLLLLTSIVIYILGDKIYAATTQPDLLEQAFQPAMNSETIVNLGAGKNAVGNEILQQGVGVSVSIGAGCDINGQKVSKADITTQKNAVGYGGDESAFCTNILGGTYNNNLFQGSITTEAPLIVRIAKFLLRITMVLSVTMVIFNGIMWIIESAKGAEVKDAKKNITLIVVGILISLMSLGIINLISSITVSSLGVSSSNVPGCSINGAVLQGDNLKAYICVNSTFGTTYTGTWYPDRIGNRCKRNGNYTAITDTEMITKCVELGGEYKN